MEEKNEKSLDAIAEIILQTLEREVSVAPAEIARYLGETRRKAAEKPDAWRRYMKPVKQQMLFLAREGKIEIVRKGEVVDPEDFRGVVRMRLKVAD